MRHGRRSEWLTERCWLAQFSNYPCEGPLVRVHLVSKQAIKRKGGEPWDPRAWVWACGGLSCGNEGHHGRFDAYKLRVPREALPAAVEALAEELNMGYYLERRYGPRAD